MMWLFLYYSTSKDNVATGGQDVEATVGNSGANVFATPVARICFNFSHQCFLSWPSEMSVKHGYQHLQPCSGIFWKVKLSETCINLPILEIKI